MARFELVVVGGGMVGMTLIAALQPAIEQGLGVTLIDPAPQPQQQLITSPSFDGRATALSAQALQVFSALKMAHLEQALSNIQEIEVSDRGQAGFLELHAQKLGFQRFGAVIANADLGALLWQKIQSLPVHWRFNNQVVNLSPQQNGQSVTLANGTLLHADLVILCDGGRSKLHESLGFSLHEKSFKALARVATLTTAKAHQGRAFERFTELGPIALLPFGKASTLVWTVPEALSASLPNSPAATIPWLEQRFGQRLGRITGLSDWSEYPLTERQMPTLCSHGFLALGNAAATLHPVAGQGFNLALRGLARTAKLINGEYAQAGKVPSFRQLNAVAATISRDQANTAGISRELIQLFQSSAALLRLGRGLGLNSLDRHPILRQGVALAGMGLLEDVPALTPA
jgi:2-octaprenyl-6-methoxyphenol hydroxylase